jgi:restriction system protein
MTIPDFQSIMLPLLKLAASSNGRTTARDAVAAIGNEFNLTEAEREELLPSGRGKLLNNRVGWARTHLSKAGLISSRGVLIITDRGREALAQSDSPINMRYLRQYPEYLEFVAGRTGTETDATKSELVPDEAQSPEELLENAYQELNASLAIDLLERVKQNSASYFEQLVVDVIVAMGYGGSRPNAGRALGRSRDGGVDGLVNEDVLGLDVVYVQAKRWDEKQVSRPDVQAFVGSLEGHRARKCVFITTSTFSGDAREYVRQIDKRVVLIDGRQLAQLMIEYGVGVTSVRTLTLKKLDLDYFEE